MGIQEEDIARVRSASDFIAIASEHIALKRVGQNYQGLCPFHGEKTPSFSINPEKGVYFCYGCGAKGDVITFVRDLEHLDFAGAVERLASKANIVLRYDNEAASRDRVRRAKLLDAVAAAMVWYHERLLHSPDAGKARSYLRSRGFDGESIRQFQIGWAPEGWDTLCRSLSLSTEVAKDSGLGYVNKVNKVNDFFQSRILFPIFDASGAPIAFGGRKLPEADGPKYKNSAESKLYSKSKTLYGLNWAKSGIVQEGEVIVCEGYTDVIGFHRAGLARAVATCGTALADEHFRMLKNFARRIVLAYDADNAGQNAAEKFYAWERQFEVDIHVVALPPGADPADLARNDPDALKLAVAEARPFLQFRLERLLAAANLKTAEGRARAYEEAADAISAHPNALVREQYLRDVAGRCQISEETMARTLAEGPRRIPATNPASDGSSGGRGQKSSNRTYDPSRSRDYSPQSSGANSAGNRGADSAANRGANASAGRGAEPTTGRAGGAVRPVANEEPTYDRPPEDEGYFDGFDHSPDSGRGAGGSRSPNGAGFADRSRPGARFSGSSSSGPSPLEVRPASTKGRATSALARGEAAKTGGQRAELEALRWAIAEPGRVLPWLHNAFFATPLHARSFELLEEHGDVLAVASHLESDEYSASLDNSDASAVDDSMNQQAIALLYRLAMETPQSEFEDALSMFVRNTGERVISQLSARGRISVSAQDVAEISALKSTVEGLSDPQRRGDVLPALVDWLSRWFLQQRTETPPTN